MKMSIGKRNQSKIEPVSLTFRILTSRREIFSAVRLTLWNTILSYRRKIYRESPCHASSQSTQFNSTSLPVIQREQTSTQLQLWSPAPARSIPMLNTQCRIASNRLQSKYRLLSRPSRLTSSTLRQWAASAFWLRGAIRKMRWRWKKFRERLKPARFRLPLSFRSLYQKFHRKCQTRLRYPRKKQTTWNSLMRWLMLVTKCQMSSSRKNNYFLVATCRAQKAKSS